MTTPLTLSQALVANGLKVPLAHGPSTPLADADAALYVGTWTWFTVGALTGNRSLWLRPNGAGVGDSITITRPVAGAFTVAVFDAGNVAVPLFTLGTGKAGFARFVFDGSHWSLKAFG